MPLKLKNRLAEVTALTKGEQACKDQLFLGLQTSLLRSCWKTINKRPGSYGTLNCQNPPNYLGSVEGSVSLEEMEGQAILIPDNFTLA